MCLSIILLLITRLTVDRTLRDQVVRSAYAAFSETGTWSAFRSLRNIYIIVIIIIIIGRRRRPEKETEAGR